MQRPGKWNDVPGNDAQRKDQTIAAKQQHSADIEKWLKLIRAEGVGPTIFKRLIEQFTSIEHVFEASVHNLTKVEGIGTRTAERIFATRQTFDAATEIALADRLGVWIMTMADKRYPPALKDIYDPPPVLYVKGDIVRSDSLAVAIVGSRRCTTYGREQAARFAHMLASAGFTIVSGMARGIDTAAHRGALAGGGRTIAVQGCGLSNVFPSENKKLFAATAESGACISELPLGYEPLSENFPGRNRIIAGLCMGVIIIEASAGSGSLITAKAALEYNREVMAIPGMIDSHASKGSHLLIKQGARLVDGIDDVMDALGHIGKGLKDHTADAAERSRQRAEMPLFDAADLNLSDAERVVYGTLDGEPMHTDELIAQCRLAAGQVSSALISLRLKGLIRQLPGNVFLKK